MSTTDTSTPGPTTSGDSAVTAALARLRGGDEPVNVLADPAAAEAVGSWLAANAGASDVQVVVVWDAPGPAVLGHIVARELGARVVRAYEIEGLVELEDEVGSGQRAVALADHFPTPNSVNALVGVARNGGLDVVALLAAVGSRALGAAGVPVVVVDGVPGEDGQS